MSKLKEALDAGIDEAHSSGEVPEHDTRVASDGDETPAEKETPSESDGEEDATGKETPSPEGDEDESDDSEDSSSTEEPKDLLEGMSESKRKALLKFAPGGKITTPEELQAAEGKLVDDYWRNHNRLAEKVTEEKTEVPPTAPKAEEIPVPPPVKAYDDILQGIVKEAADADDNIKGWRQELTKKMTEINAYRQRLRDGDESVTERGLLSLIDQREEIEGHVSGWTRRFERLNKDYSEKAARREEVRVLHEIKARADAQETEAKKRQETQTQQDRDKLVAGAGDFAIKEVKVPAEEGDKYRQYLRFTISEHFRNNPNVPIDDLQVFAKKAAEDFMGPVLRERKRALETYNRDKSKDAPTPPSVPKKKGTSPSAGGTKAKGGKDRLTSMTDLETLVQGSQHWGE